MRSNVAVGRPLAAAVSCLRRTPAAIVSISRPRRAGACSRRARPIPITYRRARRGAPLCKGSCRANARLRDCKRRSHHCGRSKQKTLTIPPSRPCGRATSLYTREATLRATRKRRKRRANTVRPYAPTAIVAAERASQSAPAGATYPAAPTARGISAIRGPAAYIMHPQGVYHIAQQYIIREAYIIVFAQAKTAPVTADSG